VGLERIRKRRPKTAQHVAHRERHAARLVEMHDVEELVRQHQLEPVAVLQQLAFVGRRKKDPRVIERQGRGKAVREVGGVEQHHVGARARLPGEHAGDARIDPFGDRSREAGLRAVVLGEMHREMRRVQRAPAQAGIDPVKLQLRGRRRAP